MAYGQLNVVLAHLRRLVHQPGAGVDDGVLLERFVRQRDEAAFEVLVWRHGPMVLSLARRLLRSPHDAEDVLQATFLTLVRKASSIGKRESIASWLYKVAYRIALRARVRRVNLPVPAGFLEHIPAPATEAVDPELRSLLDKAILRLPDKYRTAIVLCHLEGKNVGEVATQLGCPLGTVSARLTRGRELLRKRLTRNGAALSSGGLAALLSHEAASAAVPTALVQSTLRSAWGFIVGQAAVGSVSANVATLIEGASTGTVLSKFTLGLAVVAAGSLAIGASGLTRRDPPSPAPVSQATLTKPSGDQIKQTDASDARRAKPPVAGNVVVMGRVLDPNGTPVVGARLYYPRWPKAWDSWATDYGEIENPERGVTGTDGRFRIELPGSDIHSDGGQFLVAAAEGYGLDGATLPRGESSAELTLKLVKDLPIEGRILNTEGRPLSGIEVIVQGVMASPQERLDEFLEGWKREWWSPPTRMTRYLHLPGKKVWRAFRSDKYGRFRIAGVGRERVAQLSIRGPAIAQASVYVLTREGLDPAPYNQAAQTSRVQPHPNEIPPPLLYGPTFTHVAAPGRVIAGTVHEAENHKPAAGIVITARAGSGNTIRAVSDVEGKYELKGLPKRKLYPLYASPDPNSPLLRRDVEVSDQAGQGPIRVDIEVSRGITLSGRIIDKATGKGVRGFVQFSPGSSFVQESTRNWTESRTDDAVSFQLKVLPGKGLLWGQAYAVPCGVAGKPVQRYRRARLDPGDRLILATNFYEKLDVPEGVASLTRDLYLDPGKTVRVHVQDPDGDPLTGTTVVNLADFSGNNAVTFAEAECPVYALDPATPRRVLFYHATRNLVGSLTLRGDEKELPVARLAPAGVVTGRVLDRDGQPVVDANIYIRFQERSFDDLYWRAHEKQWFRTDKEGRFHLRGMPPNVKLRTLEFRKGREELVAEPWKKPASVAPGETLDVGDIHAKPP